MRGLLILASVSARNRQALDLASGYFLKLWLPALAWLSDDQEDQSVLSLAELVVCCLFHGPTIPGR